MEKLSLELSGMGCGACVNKVRNVLSALPGVVVTSVSVGSANLSYDAVRLSLGEVTGALVAAGYQARLTGGSVTAGETLGQNGGHCGVRS